MSILAYSLLFAMARFFYILGQPRYEDLTLLSLPCRSASLHTSLFSRTNTIFLLGIPWRDRLVFPHASFFFISFPVPLVVRTIS